jgi:hypothetical protein
LKVNFPSDLSAAIARAGAILAAISDRPGYIGEWWVDHSGWCVLLLSPEREEFRGLTLKIALAWCLVYFMTDEIGIGQFRALRTADYHGDSRRSRPHRRLARRAPWRRECAE